jgi:hypothetical protein
MAGRPVFSCVLGSVLRRVHLSGFDEAEANTLRKIIAKKAGGAKLAAYQK